FTLYNKLNLMINQLEMKDLNDNLKQHLKDLEESHIALNIRNDPDKLANILADDFMEIGSSGYIYDKKDCLEFGVVLTEMSLRSSIRKWIDGNWQHYCHQGTITQLQITDT